MCNLLKTTKSIQNFISLHDIESVTTSSQFIQSTNPYLFWHVLVILTFPLITLIGIKFIHVLIFE